MIKCELCNREFESLRSLGLHLSHSNKEFSHKEYYVLYYGLWMISTILLNPYDIYESVQKLTYRIAGNLIHRCKYKVYSITQKCA